MMKQIICFQEPGEMVQPSEEGIVVISNGLSISGEMVGVGGTKSVRNYVRKLLSGLEMSEVEITSMDLKFSNKGYNFMSVTLSTVESVEMILAINNPPLLNGKRVFIKPALFQPRRNMNRPVGKTKPNNRTRPMIKQQKLRNNTIFDFNEDFPEIGKTKSNKW